MKTKNLGIALCVLTLGFFVAVFYATKKYSYTDDYRHEVKEYTFFSVEDGKAYIVDKRDIYLVDRRNEKEIVMHRIKEEETCRREIVVGDELMLPENCKSALLVGGILPGYRYYDDNNIYWFSAEPETHESK